MPKKVYRLEDKDGNGPYSGEQDCIRYLKPHRDPEEMMRKLRLPDEVLKALSAAQFVFGWSRLSDYKKFFKRGGQKSCDELGFSLNVYRPEFRFDFQDGQVMFSKPNTSIETPHLKLFLEAIKKLRVFPDSTDG